MADVSQIKLPNGSVYDLIDEKSGYITADYIENKTDYEIPVSRVGEIVVGETAIGTDSTNFPTSKAVVDYVDERVVQEMDAIDVGVISVNGKTGAVTLSASDVGAITQSEFYNEFDSFANYIRNQIPTSTSQLTNDSGFITSETDPTVPAWAKASTKPTYTASEVGALPDSTVIPQIFMVAYNSSTNTADKTYTEINQAYRSGNLVLLRNNNNDIYQIVSNDLGYRFTTIDKLDRRNATNEYVAKIKQLSVDSSNIWHTYDYKLPRKTSDLTNDSGYLTASDIASVMTYKGTKANYAALPSTGNTTGDVWHLTDTGAEWAWDGSAWQELGTAIDLSGYATKATTLAGYGITDAKIQNGVITLGSNTITPLTSFTETDPVFSASAAAGITSTDISNWNAKPSTDTNTTYTLSNALASHKFTSTLTAGGSGSGTSTATMEFVAGTGITLTDDTTNKKITIASSVVNTDEKVKLTSVSTAATYPLILGPSSITSGTAYEANYTNKISLGYGGTQITLKVGDTTNNQLGAIQLYSNNTAGWTVLKTDASISRAITLPDKNGTIALTSDIPTVYSSTNTGGYLTMATLPIYDGTVE